MDAKFQPSFIPKQPVSVPTQTRVGYISLLFVVGLIVFILTIGLIAAELIAEKVLSRDIANLNRSLVEAKSSLELSTIDELKKTASRTGLAMTLITAHIAPSKLLEAIEQSVFANVSLSGLSLAQSESGGYQLNTTGVAGSYNSLQLQSEFLSTAPFLSNPAFSNFKLDPSVRVSFSFSAEVSPKLVNYSTYVSN